IGASLLLTTLPKLIAGELIPIKQDDTKATFAANIKREQEKVDWSQTNLEVYNQIRGLRPWPVAFTTYKSATMNLWHVELDQQAYDGQPGEIVKLIDKEAFVVLCGNYKGIKLTEIQPAGSKRMTVAEYLRGSADRIQLGY